MKVITIDNGQCLIDIALQEYGNLEAVDTICADNGLDPDTDLFAGQKLNIRESAVDDVPYINANVLAEYTKLTYGSVLPYLVNSKVPGAESVSLPTNLPSYYRAGGADYSAGLLQDLTTIFTTGKVANKLPFVADMQRLWYIYPEAYGSLVHAYQVGMYDQLTTFDKLTVTLTISGNQESYLAYRLKHDTYLLPADNFTISFE